MGMTSDYSIAIEEGATIVRIGRAILANVRTSSGLFRYTLPGEQCSDMPF